ncbi:MAG: peptidase, partial [Pseudomonadota bacterium]
MRSIVLLVALILAGVPAVVAAPTKQDVINTYSDIAVAKYEDSLTVAKALQVAVDKLIAKPTSANLEA